MIIDLWIKCFIKWVFEQAEQNAIRKNSLAGESVKILGKTESWSIEGIFRIRKETIAWEFILKWFTKQLIVRAVTKAWVNLKGKLTAKNTA